MAMPLPLSIEMQLLIGQIKTELKKGQDHWTICQIMANRHDLWDDKNRFPIWLSRVVEGVIRDLEASDEDVI